MDPLKIFIGYDPVENVSFHTLIDSINTHATRPISITPVNLRHFSEVYKRDHDRRQSNEFSFTRFLTPYLCGFRGFALFMDCDMLLRADISELFSFCSMAEDKAVHVVKHDYESSVSVKYLGKKQYSYPRKNWSSIMLFNCSHQKNLALTPEYIERASAADLHRFAWLADEEIGELGVEWNWLVDEYDESELVEPVKIVHWTLGGPYFKEFHGVPFTNEWEDHLKNINYAKQIDDITN